MNGNITDSSQMVSSLAADSPGMTSEGTGLATQILAQLDVEIMVIAAL